MTTVPPISPIAGSTAAPARRSGVSDYPSWAMRTWHGMTFPVWFGLLKRNRFAIARSRRPLVACVTFVSVFNSVLAGLQRLLYSRRISRQALPDNPIFIIGHWRTGTTFLHELLASDPRFIWPTTYECFAPSHFLVSGGWLKSLVNRFTPSHRPMDGMAFGLDRPMEDEFALLNLGLGSPQETDAFPNHRPVRAEFLNLTEISERQLGVWQNGFLRFLRQVVLARGGVTRRLLLKSPQHTARLPVLLRLFPNAVFIHAVRNPSEVFASTIRLHKTMFAEMACQDPRFGALDGGVPGIEEYVLRMLVLLYRDFDAQVARIPEAQFCEVRYEDLARQPLEELERIYRRLRLGSFDEVRGKIGDYLVCLNHAPTAHVMQAEAQAAVTQRWADYIRRHRY